MSIRGIISLLCVIGTLIHGQTVKAQSFLVRQFTTEDGLAHNVGFDIHQDQKGLLWFGTDNGLCRYDGRAFRTYTTEDGLNRSAIISLWEDPVGRLMVGPHRSGINYVSEDSFLNFPINFRLTRNPVPCFLPDSSMLIQDVHPKSLRYLFVRALKKEPEWPLEYWILTDKEGTPKFEKIRSASLIQAKRSRFAIEYANRFKTLEASLFQDASQNVFLYCTLGCWRVIWEGGFSLEPAFSGLAQFPVESMTQDPEGRYWLVGEKDIFQIDPSSGYKRYAKPNNLSRVIQSKAISESKLFLLDENRSSLVLADFAFAKTNRLDSLMELSSEISFIETDREGNLWLTTMGDGVWMIREQTFTNYQFADPKRSFVNDITHTQDGSVWAVSRNGLTVFVGDKVEYLPLPTEGEKREDQQIHAIIEAAPHELYFNARDSLWSIDSRTRQIRSLRFAAFEGLGRTLNDRLVFLNSRIDSPYTEIDFWMRDFSLGEGSFDERQVRSVLTKDGGKIRTKFSFKAVSQSESWFSTGQELYRIREGELQKFGRAEGLPSDFVNDINQDAEGTLWVATEKGAAFYDESQEWQIFEPLAKISCRKLVFDRQNHLWVGTQQGLFRWDGLVLERFDNRMGLVSNDINSLVLDQLNRLWIGTSRGVSRLDLQQMIRGGETPVLITRRVELDGNPIPSDSIPEIRSSQSLSWEYAGLYYTNPQEVVYRYRFFPQDDWQYTEQDRISASLLQPGSYRLQIEVRNARSEWGSQLNFPFVVLRPWWQSIWAIMLGVLLLGFLFAGIFYFRLQIIKAREERKREVSKRIAELELKALEAQMNPHFIFNALNAIQYFVLENDAESSHRYLTRFAKLMRMFLESSRKSEHSLADELEMLRYYIEMEQLCYEDVFEYEIRLEESLFAEDILLPAMLLQPFVENAIRHGLLHKQNGEGRLYIIIKKKGEQLVVLIQDNGIGRKKMAMLKQKVEREYVSRAMQIVNERIQLQAFVENVSIQIEITDQEPEKEIDPGTIVSVSMPYREAIFV